MVMIIIVSIECCHGGGGEWVLGMGKGMGGVGEF